MDIRNSNLNDSIQHNFCCKKKTQQQKQQSRSFPASDFNDQYQARYFKCSWLFPTCFYRICGVCGNDHSFTNNFSGVTMSIDAIPELLQGKKTAARSR